MNPLVMMVTLLCGWGEGYQCEMMPPEYVTLEKCREEQAKYLDIHDHIQIKCIRQNNT